MSKKHYNVSRWLNEKALFKDIPYCKDEKKAELLKRREQVALNKRHKEYCESLYL